MYIVVKTEMNTLQLTQKNYFVAKAAYEIARKNASKLDKPFEDAYDKGTISEDDLCEFYEKHDKQFKVTELHNILRKAENEMLDVVRKIMLKKYPNHASDINKVHDSGLYKIKRQLVDMAARLEA